MRLPIARPLRVALLAGTVAGSFTAAPAGAQQLGILAGGVVGSTYERYFSNVVAFGDSYADIGNLFKITGTNPATTIYPTGRFSGGTNFNDTLSGLLGVPDFNFAVGGAKTTSNVVNPFLPGFVQQVGAFALGGYRILPTDVVTLSIGGNDARQYQTGNASFGIPAGTLAGAPAAASTAAITAQSGINTLVGLGARTVVFTAGDAGTLPEVATNPTAQAIRSAFSTTYNTQMQAYLSGIAASGVRVEYVDLGAVGAAIAANPVASGITGVVCPAACVGNPQLQAQYSYYVDALHLTSAAFAWVGTYIDNRLNAPATFAAQGDLGMIATGGFVSTMFNRLDLFGADPGPSIVSAPVYAPGRVTKGPLVAAPVAPPPSSFSVYILANGGYGSRRYNGASAGYSYDSLGGTIGAEYRWGRQGIVGAAFQYSDSTSRFYTGLGKTDLQSYQFGLYGAWTQSNFFAQGVFSYGFQDYRNTRSGVLLGNLLSKPSGTSVAAGGKVGYLFDLPFSLSFFGSEARDRLGPIGGLTYASSRVNGYTENGDIGLALGVGRQRVETFTGSAGLQLRSDFTLFGFRLETFNNVTAENDFRGTGRTIQYDALSAPTIVNTYAIPNRSNRVYGKTTGGISVSLGYGVSASIATFSTFGRRGGDDYGAQGGLKYAF